MEVLQKTVSANNASASRKSNSTSAKLPKGWSIDSMSKLAYHTDVKISDQARYGLKEIYGSIIIPKAVFDEVHKLHLEMVIKELL